MPSWRQTIRMTEPNRLHPPVSDHQPAAGGIAARARAAAGPQYLAGLNPEQREAVETLDGPVLVLAGGCATMYMGAANTLLQVGVAPDFRGRIMSVYSMTAGGLMPLGGMLFGWLSDRYGRARALVWCILTFSLLTAFTATSRSVGELVFWRALVGVGLGGEWAAGAVLVAASSAA